MKIIIAGGRDITDQRLVDQVVAKALRVWGVEVKDVVVVSGCSAGVDRCGEVWALANNIPIEYFPAMWQQLGRAAGPTRNREMAKVADRLILIWDGKSPGSASMRREMHNAGKLHIWEHIVGVTEI